MSQRVSGERLAEIAPESGPCLPIELWESHSIAYDLRDARLALTEARADAAALRAALLVGSVDDGGTPCWCPREALYSDYTKWKPIADHSNQCERNRAALRR